MLMNGLWGITLRLLAAGLCLAPLAGHADEVPIPVRQFFGVAAMSRPVLSPSGKYLAVSLTNAKGRRQLGIISLEPPRQARSVSSFIDADVAEVQWVNDDRLVFSINDLQSAFEDSITPVRTGAHWWSAGARTGRSAGPRRANCRTTTSCCACCATVLPMC